MTQTAGTGASLRLFRGTEAPSPGASRRDISRQKRIWDMNQVPSMIFSAASYGVGDEARSEGPSKAGVILTSNTR